VHTPTHAQRNIAARIDPWSQPLGWPCSGFAVFAGNETPHRQGAALRLKMSVRRFALKTLPISQAKIARTLRGSQVVKIFLFIFSSLV